MHVDLYFSEPRSIRKIFALYLFKEKKLTFNIFYKFKKRGLQNIVIKLKHAEIRLPELEEFVLTDKKGINVYFVPALVDINTTWKDKVQLIKTYEYI